MHWKQVCEIKYYNYTNICILLKIDIIRKLLVCTYKLDRKIIFIEALKFNVDWTFWFRCPIQTHTRTTLILATHPNYNITIFINFFEYWQLINLKLCSVNIEPICYLDWYNNDKKASNVYLLCLIIILFARNKPKVE